FLFSLFFFFSSRRRHTRWPRDWSSDVCSSDLNPQLRADNASASKSPKLARQLGVFDATMIVMGGIIGSGIFINSYVVARQVHTPFLILGVWFAGGVIALLGAFIYAELADRYPDVGGQYAY